MLRHDAAAILFEIKCAHQVGMRSRLTWSNIWPYASMVGSWHLLAFSNKRAISKSKLHTFLFLACVLNYHDMND